MSWIPYALQPLIEARKIGIHLKIRDDCHVSTLHGSGRDTYADYVFIN